MNNSKKVTRRYCKEKSKKCGTTKKIKGMLIQKEKEKEIEEIFETIMTENYTL